MMRNVRRFYDCSTAHLPEQTVQAIENGLFAKSPSLQNEHGWLFSVPETLADLPEGATLVPNPVNFKVYEQFGATA